MRALFEKAGASHLPFLDIPDVACCARMHARKAAGGDGAEFDHLTSYFVRPDGSKGFKVVRYARGS